MKTRRQHATEDDVTISRRSTRSLTSIENSETIPIDLIIEILLRLPTKSIARCRCVSKVWASILRRTYFTELFLTRSRARPQLLFCCKKNGELFFFFTPQVRNPDENSSLVACGHQMKFPYRYPYEIRGPLRGFIYLTHIQISNGRKKTVPVICNPSTRQAIPLPKVKTKRILMNSYLGFDPIDKQFKLLSMTTKFYGERFFDEHQVLTLGTKKLSWRRIECCISCHYLPGYANKGICINGVIYYLATVNGPPKVCGIVCFDVRSEKFTVINKSKNMLLWSGSTLVSYKGRLGALLLNRFRRIVTEETECFELWVLVDAEKHEWSKHLYVLPPVWKNVVAGIELYFVGLTNTDEIVLSTRRYLFVPFYVFYYSIEKNDITRVEIQGMDAFKDCRVHISLNHVEDVKLLQYV